MSNELKASTMVPIAAAATAEDVLVATHDPEWARMLQEVLARSSNPAPKIMGRPVEPKTYDMD
jgi:hypothetical protein